MKARTLALSMILAASCAHTDGSSNRFSGWKDRAPHTFSNTNAILDRFFSKSETMTIRRDRIEFSRKGLRERSIEGIEARPMSTIVPFKGNAIAGKFLDNGNGAAVLFDDGKLTIYSFTEDAGYRIRSYQLLDSKPENASIRLDGDGFVVSLPNSIELRIRKLENGEIEVR